MVEPIKDPAGANFRADFRTDRGLTCSLERSSMLCRLCAGTCSSEPSGRSSMVLEKIVKVIKIDTAATHNPREHRSRRLVFCLHTTETLDAVAVELARLQAKVRDFAALSDSIVSFVEEDARRIMWRGR